MHQAALSVRIGKLVLGIVVLLLFINVFLPALNRSSSKLQHMAAVLDEQGIDPSRYYYTDIEAVSEANHEVSNTLRFMPTGPEGAPAAKVL